MTAPKQRVARRIVQYADSPILSALSDDGCLFVWDFDTKNWKALPALPDREEPDDALDYAR